MRLRRPGITVTGLLSAGVLAAAVVLAPGSGAAEPAVEVAGLPDKGRIELRSSSSGANLRYLDADGRLVGSIQQVAVACPSSGFTLLATGPSSGKVCFGSRGFGIDNGGPVPYLRPAVTKGEVLSLAPGGDAKDYEIRALDLDIESVRDTEQVQDLQITSFDEEGAQLEQRRLNLSSFPRRVFFPRNFQVEVELVLPAARVELTALGATAFQLEGDTQRSALELTDITTILQCGERLVVDGAEVTLIGNDCPPEPVLVTFDPDTQELEIRKDEAFDGLLDVRTVFTQAADVDLELVADYFDNGGDRIIPFCEDDGAYDPADLTTVRIPVDAIPGDARDGACLLERAEVYIGDGLAEYDVRFVLGVDPRIRLRS
jgi:hypothetical protein